MPKNGVLHRSPNSAFYCSCYLPHDVNTIPIYQDHGNPFRVVSLFVPPKETIKQVLQTRVDTSNEALWSMVKSLQEFFTRQLRAVAMPSNILKSVPDESVLLSTTFMCAHDSFSDRGLQVTPHLVADCTEVSKQMADIIVKYKMQDNEKQPYENIVRNAEKAAQKAGKKLSQAKKVVAAMAKKVKAINDKTVKSGANTPAKLKQNKSLVKAQKAVDNAQIEFDKLSKAAVEASKKSAVVFDMQSDIIQKWQGVITKMKPTGLCVGDALTLPACTESCKLHLAPCVKGKGSKGQCAYAIFICEIST